MNEQQPANVWHQTACNLSYVNCEIEVVTEGRRATGASGRSSARSEAAKATALAAGGAIAGRRIHAERGSLAEPGRRRTIRTDEVGKWKGGEP